VGGFEEQLLEINVYQICAHLHQTNFSLSSVCSLHTVLHNLFALVCFTFLKSWPIISSIKLKTVKFKFGRSRYPRGLRRGSAAACLLGLRVPVPPEVCISVSFECCVLSGRGLCDGPIPRPEECVCVWNWMWQSAKITLYTYNEEVEEVRLRKKRKCKFVLVFN
jgi:hypothetical protein